MWPSDVLKENAEFLNVHKSFRWKEPILRGPDRPNRFYVTITFQKGQDLLFGGGGCVYTNANNKGLDKFMFGFGPNLIFYIHFFSF